MQISNTGRIIIPAVDSQFRLVPCSCGNKQPAYLVESDEKWRVVCMNCQKETRSFGIRHDAQMNWNKEVAQ